MIGEINALGISPSLAWRTLAHYSAGMVSCGPANVVYTTPPQCDMHLVYPFHSSVMSMTLSLAYMRNNACSAHAILLSLLLPCDCSWLSLAVCIRRQMWRRMQVNASVFLCLCCLPSFPVSHVSFHRSCFSTGLVPRLGWTF